VDGSHWPSNGFNLTGILVLLFGYEPIYPHLAPLAIFLNWFQGQRQVPSISMTIPDIVEGAHGPSQLGTVD